MQWAALALGEKSLALALGEKSVAPLLLLIYPTLSVAGVSVSRPWLVAGGWDANPSDNNSACVVPTGHVVTL